MNFQRTLKRPVRISGVGLHSGKEINLLVKPARPNRGIVFVRTDLPGSPEIAANFNNVVSTQLATTLGRGKVTVSTVEHLMAALQGLDIDNAIIEVDAPEVPILDGSSVLFCEALEAGGVISQIQPRARLSLRRRVELKVDEKWAVAEPSSRLEIHASVEFDHPSIGYQEFKYIEGKTSFAELSTARTFGFLREVEALKAMGLARGGSLENCVVLDDALILNPEGLRSPDEFVRHKVLDALGDFKLAGIAIQAHIRLHRAGHDIHRQLLSAIFANPDNYEIIDGTPEEYSQPSAARAVFAVARTLVASV